MYESYDSFYVGLDFETFCDVDLPKRGGANYFASDTFEPLIAAMHSTDSNRSAPAAIVYDFVLAEDSDKLKQDFFQELHRIVEQEKKIAAHNASFEANTLKRMGVDFSYAKFVDTAVIASAHGAGRRLAQAAPQLLDLEKMEEGANLIKLFSIPNKRFDFKRVTAQHLKDDPELMEKWEVFKQYCLVDAKLSYMIAKAMPLPRMELYYAYVTEQLNRTGWTVDLDVLEAMQQRYAANCAEAEDKFRSLTGDFELNLNSPIQLQKWCRARGVNFKSFDEATVLKMLPKVQKKLSTMAPTDKRFEDYSQVAALLETKRILGGSALKKLATIQNQVTPEGKLLDQYLHLGASQTFRTTGRGVQMQNIKRLPPVLKPVETIFDSSVEWTNEDMAANMRQLFRASNPDPERGALIVGDFSSVESRGLAWLAGEQWKLKAYNEGKDIYKVLAAEQFGVDYDDVSKEQRKFGKVGELSCGYGAGPGAVQSFAEGMGVALTEQEALKIVKDWRGANNAITGFWERLDRALHRSISSGVGTDVLVGPDGADFKFRFIAEPEVDSLTELHPGAQKLSIIFMSRETVLFTRVFRGCYERGRNICYYKPTGLKTGALWSGSYMDPKTKRQGFYDIYGGKLAGILTQSFCRELFFYALRHAQVHFSLPCEGVKLVGQFHDEIVLDADLDELASIGKTFEHVARDLESIMSDPYVQGYEIPGFPLAAEVNYAWRYIK